MRFRQMLRVLLCILTPVFILACSVGFTGGDFHKWLKLQRDLPLLWLVDFCAVYTFVLLTAAIVGWDKSSLRLQELIALREENNAQWEAVSTQSEGLDRERDDLLRKVAELEQRQEQSLAAQEGEARLMTEHAFRAVQGQIEAQGRQLEAVNMALQHHRAEISQLRQITKGAPAPNSVEAHFAEPEPEYAAVAAAPLPRSLSERRETLAIQPAHDPDAVNSNAQRSTIEI